MLSSLLHSFVDSSRGGVPFRATPLPVLGLSEGDKQCIRDRSSIMARHIFADKSEDFIDAQVWNFTCFFLILLLHEFQIFFGHFLYPPSITLTWWYCEPDFTIYPLISLGRYGELFHCT